MRWLLAIFPAALAWIAFATPCTMCDGNARDPNLVIRISGSEAIGGFETGVTAVTSYRINAGGGAYTDGQSNQWQACNTAGPANPCTNLTYSASNGDVFSTGNPIAGTTDDPLFQSIAVPFGGTGSSLRGAFPVVNGTYRLNLYFNEIVSGYTAGQRLANISVEGTLVQSNFDIVAEAGASLTALVKTYPLTISDGVVNFELFNVGTENPILSAVEILPSTSGPPATERPVANNNGFRSPNQTPILFDNDTLVAGWAGATPINSLEPAAGTINCAGASGTVSGEYVIRDIAGVAELSSASMSSDVVWVCPGDYRTAPQITLQDSGTTNDYIQVKCLVTDRTTSAYSRNSDPVPSAANGYATQHFAATECMLPEVVSLGAPQFWLFQGISFAHSVESEATPLINLTSGDSIIFDRTWFDCSKSTAAFNSGEHDCIRFGDAASKITVQQSVIGPCAPMLDATIYGVHATSNMVDMIMVRSEVFNCSTGVYIGDLSNTGGTGLGHVVEDNDIYSDPRTRIAAAAFDVAAWTATGVQDRNGAATIADRLFDADGAQASLFDVNGTYGCSGTPGIIVAHGDATQTNLIRLNRVWGNRGSDSRCQMGTDETGETLEIGVDAKGTVVESNFFWDNTEGIKVLPSIIANSSWANIVFRGNYIDLAFIDTSPTGLTTRTVVDVDADCSFLCTGTPPRSFTFEFNDFGQLPSNTSISAAPFLIEDRTGLTASISCNNARGVEFVGLTGSGASGDANTSINGADWSNVANLTNTLTLSTAQAAEVQRCTWRKLQTAPENACTSTVSLPTDESRYFGAYAQAGC